MTDQNIEILGDGLIRIRASNPSPMTFTGTNTYILGAGQGVAVIDPGPVAPAHMQAILAQLAPHQRITHIFVTHSHIDHSPGAAPLAQATGAPILAYGPSDAGRSEVMQRLAAQGLAGGGEGVDLDFRPDICLVDGAVTQGDGWSLRAHWTPGHMGNHHSFEWLEGRACFTGDVVMGWASSMISPPDGDLAQFLDSLDRLAKLDCNSFHPGHGDPVTDPKARCAWLRDHRATRTAALAERLDTIPRSVDDLTALIYIDVPTALLPAAARNTLATLVHMCQTGQAQAHPTLSHSAKFTA